MSTYGKSPIETYEEQAKEDRKKVGELLDYSGEDGRRLTDWEVGFVESLAERRTLSPKIRAKLEQIYYATFS